MVKPTGSTKNKPLGFKYQLLCVSKLEVFIHNYRQPTMKIPELQWCLTKISFNNPIYVLNECLNV